MEFGIEELFKDEEHENEKSACHIQEISKQVETVEEAAATVDDERLWAFKVASFASFNEEKDILAEEPEMEDESKDWDDTIPENYR